MHADGDVTDRVSAGEAGRALDATGRHTPARLRDEVTQRNGGGRSRQHGIHGRGGVQVQVAAGVEERRGALVTDAARIVRHAPGRTIRLGGRVGNAP